MQKSHTVNIYTYFHRILLLIIFIFLYFVSNVCFNMCVCTCHSTHVNTKVQFEADGTARIQVGLNNKKLRV